MSNNLISLKLIQADRHYTLASHYPATPLLIELFVVTTLQYTSVEIL